MMPTETTDHKQKVSVAKLVEPVVELVVPVAKMVELVVPVAKLVEPVVPVVKLVEPVVESVAPVLEPADLQHCLFQSQKSLRKLLVREKDQMHELQQMKRECDKQRKKALFLVFIILVLSVLMLIRTPACRSRARPSFNSVCNCAARSLPCTPLVAIVSLIRPHLVRGSKYLLNATT